MHLLRNIDSYPHAVLLRNDNIIDLDYVKASYWCEYNVGPYDHRWISKTYRNQIYFCFKCHRDALAFGIMFGELVDSMVLDDVGQVTNTKHSQDFSDFSGDLNIIVGKK